MSRWIAELSRTCCFLVFQYTESSIVELRSRVSKLRFKPDYIVHGRSVGDSQKVELVVASQYEIQDNEVIIDFSVAKELNNIKEFSAFFCLELANPPDQIKRWFVKKVFLDGDRSKNQAQYCEVFKQSQLWYAFVFTIILLFLCCHLLILVFR